MSAVTLRCPNCGTVQGAPGECEACHEAGVRYYCANHTPGRWLDAPGCQACGARVDFDPVASAPRPPAGAPPTPARPRRDAPLPPASAPPPRRPRVERVEPFEPPAPRPERRPPRRPAPRDPWADAPPAEEPDLPPRRTRRGRVVTPGDLFGPDGPFGPRGPFGAGGPLGRRGRVPDAPGDFGGGFPPVRLPTVRVPGIFGCLGRIVMLIVFLILAALAGSFVWITQF